MSHTRKDTRGHKEPRLARRAEHRVKYCAHGLPRLECDACEAERVWKGARYTSTLECLEAEAGVGAIPLPLGSMRPEWSGKGGDY